MRSIILIVFFIALNCGAFAQKYIFYLHGKIIEDQGVNAVSPEYGPYKYQAILDTFRKAGFKVISEVRKPDTDGMNYAQKVIRQIDSLVKKGVMPKDITVIGASKGAVIAIWVSNFLQNKEVNFVFMAGCTDNGVSAIKFSGNILSIYEKSDDIGRSCEKLRNISPANITHYKEIEINTGLKHGFLYQPLPEWVKPAIKWANGNYE